MEWTTSTVPFHQVLKGRTGRVRSTLFLTRHFETHHLRSMKISLVAAISALWTILDAFGSVNATECSTADLDTLKSVRDDTLKGICASSFAAGPPPANSAVPPFCGNEDCLSTLKSAVNDLPDCEINGLSIVASVKMMIIMCSSDGIPPPMPPGAANGSFPMPLPPPRPGNGPLLAWLAAAGDTNDSSGTSSNDADVEDASSASSMEGKEAANGSATVPTPAPSAAARYHVALATFVAVGLLLSTNDLLVPLSIELEGP